MAAQKKGPAEAATSPSHGSNNPLKGNAVNREHDTIAPRGGATALAAIRPTCPVVALTRRLASVRAAYRDADTRRINGQHAGPEAYQADRECQHRLDEEYALQAMIACNRAASLEGAAVQIAEIVPKLEVLWDALPDRPDADQTAAYRAAFRLLYSALDAVERHLSVPLAKLVDPKFGERHLDPWGPRVSPEGNLVSEPDPLLALVHAYEAGMVAYNGRTDEGEEAVRATYGPSFDALMDDAVPQPTTMEGALAALRLLVREGEVILDGQMASTVLPAVLGFLEREAA